MAKGLTEAEAVTNGLTSSAAVTKVQASSRRVTHTMRAIRGIWKISEARLATTVAVRGAADSTPISPKISPREIVLICNV